MLSNLASDILAHCDTLQSIGVPRAIVADLRVIAIKVHREALRLEPDVTSARLAPTDAPEVLDSTAREWAKRIAALGVDNVENNE